MKTYILTAFCLSFMLPRVLGLPAPVAPSKVASQERPQTAGLASLGHQAIDLGLEGATILASIVVAEYALRQLKVHMKHSTRRMQDAIVRKTQQIHDDNSAIREEQALQHLLDIAEKHAQKISEKGLNHHRLQPFTVPKEINKSLESIFQTKEGGTSSVDRYHKLKDALAPILDFE